MPGLTARMSIKVPALLALEGDVRRGGNPTRSAVRRLPVPALWQPTFRPGDEAAGDGYGS
jgi:hypothetical protein